MTQEDKDLLLIDLCARLPYKPKASVDGHLATVFGIDENVVIVCIDGNDYKEEAIISTHNNDVNDVKLYLRSMSNMTDEEKEELVDFGLAYWDMGKHTDEDGNVIIYGGKEFQLLPDIETCEWLNAHYFDYRSIYDKKDRKLKSMIEMGLALLAPEGMYNK